MPVVCWCQILKNMAIIDRRYGDFRNVPLASLRDAWTAGVVPYGPSASSITDRLAGGDRRRFDGLCFDRLSNCDRVGRDKTLFLLEFAHVGHEIFVNIGGGGAGCLDHLTGAQQLGEHQAGEGESAEHGQRQG